MKSENIDALWSHLHWLTVLRQQGSFTAAAARLGVSKAAMSQRIADLERAAGVPLVQRTTRSVRLTEAGERLVDGTRGAFDQIRDSFASVRDLAAEPQGLLRVTAPVAFARQQLLPCLPDFLRAHPQVRLELDMSDRLRSLATEGFDLAVRHTAAPPETHVAWALASTRTVLVASRGYLRRRGTPAVPSELASHDCLFYPRAQETPAWAFVSGEEERVTVPVSGPFSANNSEVLRDAASAGVGIALLPDFSAQSALGSGRLVEILPGWRNVDAFGDRLYAVRAYSPQVPRAVGAFVGFLRGVFKGGFSV
ncbi:LysR family transcriptional regulator [Xylophilus rhododendri]|uniref:LysR family transcriptional regulator n=1 Tax=Xylophilus rhododendri TaxID=2697032 RepID=A0A857JBY3_9BURK|nr:LysR family transcriptional regulator [Xylophilus rhododendri]QHJ01515.1 LysR family transcriptional regulator [Xylophilus rhododendri]